MEIQLPYWISNTSIIFKPEFNEPLNNHIQITSQYNKLIFSDYDDLDSCLETNNKYNIKHKNSYKGSQFNQELKNSLLNLKSLQQLIFNNFNKKLGNPLTNPLTNLTLLQQLTLDSCFKNSLSKLTSLQKLTFGDWFNHELGYSLSNLKS